MQQLRAKLEMQEHYKQEEMQELANALQYKWEGALTALQNEVSDLKQHRQHTKSKQEPLSKRDIVEVSRSEFVGLMEAAADNFASEQQPVQLAELQDQLRESQASAARASKEATAAMQRVQHLERQLRAQSQHSLLGEGPAEHAMLRGVISNTATSPARPARSPVPSSCTPPGSSWISR
eukprot:TRINITY_DN2808_c0_g2_i1.p1 TRINITY_DN2808_c0_g2~~TRINITY_DN2808_c0_g2_i1.p1  ORF type:complete len:179 (+),score=50.15 TRINITY_DN2808_c0_g2_i1:92-628(+)